MTDRVQPSVRVMKKGANLALRELEAESCGVVTAVLEVRETSAGEQLEVDVSVLLLGADGKVRSDDDLVFYNQPVALAGAVCLHGQAWVEQSGRYEGLVTLRLDDVPESVARIVLTASVDPGQGLTCRDAGGMRLRLQQASSGMDLAIYDVVSEGTELAMMFGEFYRRDQQWRFRAVGQGYAGGLESIAREFGVVIEEDSPGGGREPDGDTAVQGTGTSADERLKLTATGEDPDALRGRTRRQVKMHRARKPPRVPDAPKVDSGTEEDTYGRARLFPVAGIGGGEEQERRATSALLAVMSLVRPFGHDLLKPIGSPAGSVKTYVEVPFKLDGQAYRPDGLIVTRRGGREWRCLVEVKTGSARLEGAQVGAYVQIAREHEFDAVLTISNQICGVFGDNPVVIDRRKLKKVGLHHLSWDEIHARATLWLAHPSTGDPTAVRVVEEFARYVEYERSGLHGFDDMGPHWATIRAAVRSRTVTAGSQGAGQVCERFDQLIRHIGLHLTRLLGVEVVSVVPRHTPDQASRRQQLADSGLLFGSLKVPGAIDTIVLRADLRAERVNASVRVKAPTEGRSRTKVNWMLRQLEHARDTTKIQLRASGGKSVASRTIGAAREDPELLVPEKGMEVREFEVALDLPMGTKRGIGRGSMITSSIEVVDTFYAEVVQHVSPARTT